MDETAVNRRLILVIAVFGAAVLGLGVWFFLQYQEYSALTVDIAAKQADLATKQAKIDGLTKLEKEMERSKLNAEQYEKYLPSDEDIPGMLRQISLMAVNNKLRLENAAISAGTTRAVGPNQAKELYESRIFNISIIGAYPDIVMFLNEVERLDRFVLVNSLKITSSDMKSTVGPSEDETFDPSKPTSLSCSVLLHTFVYTGGKK
ncbi:MAG: type 4a pilus biogenesis protein PilO [Candidatus Brocadiia bacterium]